MGALQIMTSQPMKLDASLPAEDAAALGQRFLHGLNRTSGASIVTVSMPDPAIAACNTVASLIASLPRSPYRFRSTRPTRCTGDPALHSGATCSSATARIVGAEGFARICPWG